MHRLLGSSGSSSDRRAQRTHPAKKRPELLAMHPNEIWSWDITKLHGPTRGLFYDLYVILDILSRYVLNWLVAAHEDAELAKEFIEDAILTQGITRDTLTIHADRGGAMRSKPVSQLMVDLGVTKSHSRPHVSNDNPFSEAAFKTLKYCRRSPHASGASRTPGSSARTSSRTTTTNTDTRALGCTPPRRSTTAPTWRFEGNAKPR